MKIFSKNKRYLESEQNYFSYENQYDNGLVIKSEIVFLNEEYLTYQQNLIGDFLDYLDEEINQPHFSLSKFKSIFEFALQELNSKLAVFAEKLKFGEKIQIRGFIEFFKDNYYISSLIGDSSLVIFRKGRLFYSVHNVNTDNKRIDLFSELIEGDVYDGDELLFFANNVSYFTDKEDFENIADVVGLDERDMTQISEDMLKDRVELDQIGLINLETISTQNNYQSGSKIGSRFGILDKVRHWYHINKYIVGIGIFGLIILTFLGLLISNFIKSNKGVKIGIENSDGTQDSSYFSLAGIREDIDQFKTLDPSAPEKITLYQKLSNQISTLEKEGKLPLDIAELRKMLDYEYLKGFNIEQIDSIDTWMYEFNSNDLLDIGTPKGIYGKNTISVAGSDGFIINIINSTSPGTNVRSYSESSLGGCTPNLQSNGILCYYADSSIYNVTKAGAESVNIDGGAVSNIQSIGTFGNGNMYLLTNDSSLNSQGTYIARYPVAPGVANTFRTPLYYNIPADQLGSDTQLSFGDFAIDGKFLIWSKNDNSLYQYWRVGDTPNIRKINTQGGEAVNSFGSGDVKVMTYQNTNFVYLYDKQTQTLLVYKSTPNKTSEPSQYNYSLKYLFAVKLNLPSGSVADVLVGDDSRPLLYILTDRGVATLPFYNYLDSYDAIASE